MLFVFGLKGLIHLIALVDLFALPVHGKDIVSFEQCEYEVEKCEYEISPSRSLCEDMIKTEHDCVEGIEWTAPEGFVAKRKFVLPTTTMPSTAIPEQNTSSSSSSDAPVGDGVSETPSTVATILETSEMPVELNSEVPMFPKPPKPIAIVRSFSFPTNRPFVYDAETVQPTPTYEETSLLESTTVAFYKEENSPSTVERQTTIRSFFVRVTRYNPTETITTTPRNILGRNGGRKNVDSGGLGSQEGSARAIKTKSVGDISSLPIDRIKQIENAPVIETDVMEPKDEPSAPVIPIKQFKRTETADALATDVIGSPEGRRRKPKSSVGDISTIPVDQVKRTETAPVIEADIVGSAERAANNKRTKSVGEISKVPVNRIKETDPVSVLDAGIVGSDDGSRRQKEPKSVGDLSSGPVKSSKPAETDEGKKGKPTNRNKETQTDAGTNGSEEGFRRRKLSTSVTNISKDPVQRFNPSETTRMLDERKKGIPINRIKEKEKETAQVIDSGSGIIGSEERYRRQKVGKSVGDISNTQMKRVKPAETTRLLDERIASEESALTKESKSATEIKDPVIEESEVSDLLDADLGSPDDSGGQKDPKPDGDFPIPVENIADTKNSDSLLDTDVLEIDDDYDSIKTTPSPRDLTKRRREEYSEERFKKNYYSDEDTYYSPRGPKKDSVNNRGRSLGQPKPEERDAFNMHKGNSRSLTNGEDLGKASSPKAANSFSPPDSFLDKKFTRNDVKDLEDVETGLKKNFFAVVGGAEPEDETDKIADDKDLSDEFGGMLGSFL